ncbi:MAG: class I SAM-dependent methyltransferase [Caldilineaceae bacterium]
MQSIPEQEGRQAFGHNPRGYDAVRPPYPEAVFALLMAQGALFQGATTLEIGAGNGLATRRLLALGANPMTAIEPDSRFAELLQALPKPASCAYHILHTAFEDVQLGHEAFDLVVIATAFHWLDPATRVEKLWQVLKKQGYVALFWNTFQDLTKADPFHEATQLLLTGLSASPSNRPNEIPFALDRQAREAEFLSGGKFELAVYLELHWTLTLNAHQVRLLYENFSRIARLPPSERAEILDALVNVAESEFKGIVKRNMTTPLYLFRKV